MQHPNHKLHSLLPDPRNVDYNLRHVVKYEVYEPPKLWTLKARGKLGLIQPAVIVEF